MKYNLFLIAWFFCCIFRSLYSNNIVLLTVPKSGTHLLAKTIELITKTPISLGESVHIGDHLVHLDHLLPRHDSYRTNPDWKKVILIRDPRDVLISTIYWLNWFCEWFGYPYFPDLNSYYCLPHDEKITFLLHFSLRGVNVPQFIDTALQWMKEPDVTVIRFEDLVGEKGEGSHEAQIATFKLLSEMLGYPYSEEELSHLANQVYARTVTFRKGMIGSWKEEFSEEHKQLFKEKMGKALIQLGYEKDNNW